MNERGTRGTWGTWGTSGLSGQGVGCAPLAGSGELSLPAHAERPALPGASCGLEGRSPQTIEECSFKLREAQVVGTGQGRCGRLGSIPLHKGVASALGERCFHGGEELGGHREPCGVLQTPLGPG